MWDFWILSLRSLAGIFFFPPEGCKKGVVAVLEALSMNGTAKPQVLTLHIWAIMSEENKYPLYLINLLLPYFAFIVNSMRFNEEFK